MIKEHTKRSNSLSAFAQKQIWGQLYSGVFFWILRSFLLLKNTQTFHPIYQILQWFFLVTFKWNQFRWKWNGDGTLFWKHWGRNKIGKKYAFRGNSTEGEITNEAIIKWNISPLLVELGWSGTTTGASKSTFSKLRKPWKYSFAYSFSMSQGTWNPLAPL